MLVLKRLPGQDTWIDLPDGTRITVHVVEADRGCVRLGFTAPADVLIRRPESATYGREQAPAPPTKEDPT